MKYGALAFFILCGLFFSSLVFAAPSFTTGISNIYPYSQHVKGFDQSFTATETTFDNIAIAVDGSDDYYVASNSYVRGVFSDATEYARGDICSPIDKTTLAGYWLFDFSCTGKSLVVGNVYIFAVQHGGAGYYFDVAGSTAGGYDEGDSYYNTGNDGCGDPWSAIDKRCPTGMGGDVNFIVNYSEPTAPSISISYPLDQQDIAGDFTDWKFSMFTGTNGFNGKAGILYGTSTPPTTYRDAYQTYFDYTNPLTIDKTYAVYLEKSTPLTAGYYYAQAYMENSAGQTIATSTIFYFSVDNGSIIDTSVNATSTLSTSTDVVLSCDPNSGLFENSFCNLFIYLFKPSSGTFDRYNGIWAMMASKPPLGYFTKSKEALEDIGNTTSTAFTFEDVSALDDNIFAPLRAGVAWLLWAMFGIWIFNRLRHFQF